MKTKIGSSNVKDVLQAKLLSTLVNQVTEYTRILYFGQVIINDDSNNLGRIKVRIPLIDDVFYKNNNDKSVNDQSLPWCLPISNRFVDIPDTNCIVPILLSDPKTPFFGRIYFDCITDLSPTDLFEKLTPETKALSNWLNAENSVEVTIPKPVTEGEYNVSNKTKYNTGIRGRGKNKLVLGQTNTTLVQNYNDNNNESLLNLDVNSKLEAADQLRLVSKKGKKQTYHPVFDTVLFNFIEAQNRMIQKIVMLLNTVPATSPVGPCTASPTASQLINEFVTLKQEFVKLKNTGSSEKLIIN